METVFDELTKDERIRVAHTWVTRRFMETADEALNACDEALVNSGEKKLTKAERKEAKK